MGKTSEFVQKIWIKAQLDMPSSLRHAVVPRIHEAKEIARLLAEPNLPIYQLQGQGQGGPLVVTYIGLEFAKPFLKSVLFVEKPAEQRIGRIPFWRSYELANLSSSDITIVEATEHLIRNLPCQNAIVLPEYVHHILDVRGDWEDVQSRFHKTVRKNDLRRIRKYGYEYDVSHDSQDFEEFYYQMYLPTMVDRHNELSSPKSVNEAYQYFRHGCLFRVKRGGVWVSGGVCHFQQKVLTLDMIGVKNGDAQLIREGAMAARYYAAIHWANQHGYEAVNFLGTEPYLSIGGFQHKRKWGVTVRLPPHLHRRIWVRIRRNTPAVARFLKENPCIVVDGDGDLHGYVVVDDSRNVTPETVEEWEKRYVTPGMSDLLVRSVGSFAAESADGHGPDLVIPILADATLGDAYSG